MRQSHLGVKRGRDSSISAKISREAVLRSGLDAVAGVLVGDARRHRPGRGQIGLGSRVITLLSLGEPTAVERMGMVRLDAKRGIVVRDRAIHVTELQVCQTSAVEGAAGPGLQAQRLVAVRESRLQPARDGAREASVVPAYGGCRLESMARAIWSSEIASSSLPSRDSRRPSSVRDLTSLKSRPLAIRNSRTASSKRPRWA
jgi:hypothetical protein